MRRRRKMESYLYHHTDILRIRKQVLGGQKELLDKLLL
jgi:hypothetical protein